ncbi:MAG: 16S rRNA (cytidine(1402)-2'-O)-methyltransferase [Castellaniella sp.]
MTNNHDGQGTPAWEYHARLVAGQSWPEACLYVVATPIGNLADLSLRALEALRQCDVVAAEDTRTTRSLLQAWGLDVPLLAAHRHNEQSVAGRILERLRAGARVALVSDAGAPAVSDPGARIVRQVRLAGFRVVPIPGPSAVITVLMACGATTDESPGFAFAGFMPARAAARRAWLPDWLALPIPVVFFEAPHRVQRALADLLELAGPLRNITIGRELTKRHEEIVTLPLEHVMAWFAADAHRRQGEFVLVVHTPPVPPAASVGLAEADQHLMQVLLDELSVRDAVRIGARLTGLSRDSLYTWALAHRGACDSAS